MATRPGSAFPDTYNSLARERESILGVPTGVLGQGMGFCGSGCPNSSYGHGDSERNRARPVTHTALAVVEGR